MKISRIAQITVLFILLISGKLEAQIAEANKCYEEKKYDCAVANYQKALAASQYQEKDLPTIHFRIGYGLSIAKKYKDALMYLQEAAKLRPDWGSPLWELAATYYNLDSFSRAHEYYGKAIPFYKDEANSLKKIYYWKGYTLYKQRLYNAAITDFLQAYKIDSTEDYLISALGDACYDAKRYAEARNYYAKSVAYGVKNNMSSEAMAGRYYWYAQALFNAGEYVQSDPMFEKALSAGYEKKRVYWALGGSNFNQKKYALAQDYYTKAITEFRGDTSSLKALHYWRGRTLSELKEYTRAQSDFAQSIRYDPAYRAAYLETADLLRKMKKYKEAIVAYNNALPRFSTSSTDLADLHYGRGMCYLETKDTILAKSDFLFSAEYDYDFAEPHVQLGHIYFQQKKYSDARNAYNKVSDKLEDDNAAYSLIYFRKGFSNMMLNNYNVTTAKLDFEKSLKYDSLNKDANRYMGEVYYREKNWALAEKQFTKCIGLYANQKDSLANIYLYRGLVRNQQQKYKETLEDYEQTNKMKPFTKADDIKVLGQLAFQINDYPKAIGYFTRLSGMYAPEKKSDLLYAYYARGRCYLEQKKKTDAVKDFQKALEFDANNQDVKTWLTKAQQLP